MKKVLIADDELLVRIGLKSTIDWEDNGFLVVGEAKNGREAIELFEKFDPDILLTDIRMPILNGLELIQELKSRKNALKAVILTHYDDFSYAKEAINLGASEYILKSDISSDTLLSVLRKLSDQIDSSSNRSHDVSGVNIHDEVNIGLLKENLIKKIIMEDYNSREELDLAISQNKDFFEYDFFVIAAAEVNASYIKELKVRWNERLLKETLNNIMKLVFHEKYVSPAYFINSNQIVFLLNVDCRENSVDDDIKKIMDLMAVIKINIQKFMDIDFSIGLSSLAGDIGKIPGLFEEAKIALEQCFFDESGIVLFKDEMNNNKKINHKMSLETIRYYVKTLDIKNLREFINTVFDELYKTKQINNVRDVFTDFLSYAKTISIESNIKSEPVFNEAKFSYSSFSKLYTFNSVREYILDLYDELIHYRGGNKSGRYSYTINRCIEYIKSNYNRNIALEDAAEHVQISKSYLSLLFKQETGINFSSFLTNYRIEQSKKLFVDSNLKIYEIAEKVGFDNPYYFSKVFKEVTGLSCKEFKRLNSK